MISILELKKAVNDSIYEATGLKVVSHSVDDNFKKPACFVDYNVIYRTPITKVLDKWNIRFRIYYYPKKPRDEVDMLRMLGKLQDEFRLNVKCYDKDSERYRYLNILESDFMLDLESGLLLFTFRTEFMQRIKVVEEDIDIMRELEINLNKEKTDKEKANKEKASR